MSKKTRHHFIPRFYLRGFEDFESPGFVWVYDKNKGSIIKSPVSGAGVRSNYYSFTTPAGIRDTESLENLFSLIEAAGSRAFKKILGHEVMNKKDQVDLVTFLAFAMTRVPNFRENMIEKPFGEMMKRMEIIMASHKEHFETHIKHLQEKGLHLDRPVEEIRQYILKGDYDIKVGNPGYSLGHVLEAGKRLIPLFYQMHWAFLEAPNDVDFLTSDNPLYYMDPTDNGKSFWGTGLANKNIEVTFPLSKKILLLGTWGRLEGYRQIDSVMTAVLNKRTIIAAKDFVFAPFQSDDLKTMISKYKDSSPRMKVG